MSAAGDNNQRGGAGVEQANGGRHAGLAVTGEQDDGVGFGQRPGQKGGEEAFAVGGHEESPMSRVRTSDGNMGAPPFRRRASAIAPDWMRRRIWALLHLSHGASSVLYLGGPPHVGQCRPYHQRPTTHRNT